MDQAITLLKQGRLVDAERLLAKLCAQDRQNGQAWFMRGAIRLHLGDTDSALEYLRTATRVDPGNADAHFTLCRLYLSLGNLAEAIAHAKKVVELDASHGEAWLALSSFYADSGQFQQAEQASRTAIALLPGIAEAKINLVNALISQDKQDEAIALCESIKADDPAQAGIWHSLGLAFKALGLMQDAEQCLTKATKLDRENADAFCALGEVKAAQDDVSQALILYRKARELAPAFPRVHFELGKVLLPSSSARHWQLVKTLEDDHQYRDVLDAKNIARELATDVHYGDAEVERTLVRFFDEYDPSLLYPVEWWTDAVAQFGDRQQAHDTALRSVYSAVFSWSLPCRQALDEVAAFAGKRLASYGSGAGYWEFLLATHYAIDVACHDIKLRHRFVPMKQVPHSHAKLDPEDAIFLAWLPGEAAIDPAIESLLNQARSGQKLVLVGEPADDYGNPRTCGTRRFFRYLHSNFEVQARIPLANYAYFKDCVELLVRK
jgi:tetratricopeptide (TPR) repeat protein